MKCQQDGCNEQAEFLVTWPGQHTKQCGEHARQLQILDAAMGGVGIPIYKLEAAQDEH